ncbi:MAG: cation diffusion facilitator family transporter [bacterium]|nr:cation diffusion facilitator family transporter [bacterium]
MQHTSFKAVSSAIVGNTFLTIAKLAVFLTTGSAAMLSEFFHSLADTLNQVLLLVGLKRSERRADADFPFGYGAERHVWALMSAVGIFFLGCGVTLYHGIHRLLHPGMLGNLTWAIGVLALSLIVEGWVLIIAVRNVRIEANGEPFMPYLRHEADPTAAAVVLEDAAACLGVIIALGGIALSYITGSARWDAVASILIGLLLGAVALWLIMRNRHVLVGPAIPPQTRQRIREILATHPAVERIAFLRTRIVDSETYRVAAEIDFAGDVLASKLEDSLRSEYEAISSWEDFRAFAARYADQVVDVLGDEIDVIEDKIRKEFPKARYLDIEAD